MSHGRRDWAATLLRPQVLIAALALLAALPYLAGSFGRRMAPPPPPSIADQPASVRQIEFEAPLVLYDLAGRPRSALATVRSAEHQAARFAATLAALREELQRDGLWPDAVDPPRVSVFEADRRRVAVVDVPSGRALSIPVAAEAAALRSIVETLRAAGADDVQVLVDGAPAVTLWGNVALP